MNHAMISDAGTCTDFRSLVDEIPMTNVSGRSQYGRGMNCINGLNMPYFMKHVNQVPSHLVIINRYECLTFLSDEFKKSIVIGTSHYRNVINLRIVQFFIVVQEAINHISIELKYLSCSPTSRTGTKNNYRIFHSLRRSKGTSQVTLLQHEIISLHA